jgi:TPR repeat protein
MNQKRIKRLIELASSDPVAAEQLGLLFMNGSKDGAVHKDYSEAIRWLQKASLSHRVASYLAYMLEKKQNYSGACYYYNLLGDLEAQKRCLEKGIAACR